MSGNKLRKLEFLLADALRSGADTVLTAGGIQSNHCRATAVACARVGLKCVLLHRIHGADVACVDPGYAGNLLLSRCSGAQLRLIDSDELAAADTSGEAQHAPVVLRAMAQQYAAAGRHAYPVPVGGSNALGAMGYVRAAQELLEQCAAGTAAAFPYTDVVVATGSGGTLTGLALGLHLAGWSGRVHGMGVCDSPEYFYEYADKHILPEMAAKGHTLPCARELFVVHDCSGLGYAQSCDEEMPTMREAMRSAQVMLDPVYTNKAVHGLLQLMAADHQLQAGQPCAFNGSKVLFVHTGGLFGLFGQGISSEGKLGGAGGQLVPPTVARGAAAQQAGAACTAGSSKAAAPLPVLRVPLGAAAGTHTARKVQATNLEADVATVHLIRE